MSFMSVPGEPNWIELFTTDPDTAKAFYGGLFGWTVQETGPAYGGYALFLRDGEPVAGLMENDGQGADSWSVYLESNNAADTVEMAKANGGQVIVEAMQVGDLGHLAVVSDPAGASVGIWQPLEHRGFAVRGEVSAPAWFEVLSSDYDAVIPFYENVFGWDTHTMSETADLRYTTLGKDDDALAGIMDAGAVLGERPSHWRFYVEVADTDAALARANELGGAELMGPDESPYGRLASIADPSGIPFMVTGPSTGHP
jgi:predicted enzyme related to lactoylglutathione lyase